MATFNDNQINIGDELLFREHFIDNGDYHGQFKATVLDKSDYALLVTTGGNSQPITFCKPTNSFMHHSGDLECVYIKVKGGVARN